MSIDASGNDLGGDIFEVMAEYLGAEMATGEDEHSAELGHCHALDLGAEFWSSIRAALVATLDHVTYTMLCFLWGAIGFNR